MGTGPNHRPVVFDADIMEDSSGKVEGISTWNNSRIATLTGTGASGQGNGLLVIDGPDSHHAAQAGATGPLSQIGWARRTAWRMAYYSQNMPSCPGFNWAGTTVIFLISMYAAPTVIFAVAELAALVSTQTSVFVALTFPAFENGPRYAFIVNFHIWASTLMWALAAEQIFFKQVRGLSVRSWVHKRCGQAMLCLCFSVVLPTSLYLSLNQRILFLAPAVRAILLDTMVFTGYFLYRGWRVIRTRLTADSSCVHGRLMQCGVIVSMSIVPQRYLQLLLTGVRLAILAISKRFWPGASTLALSHQANYTVSVLVTAILFIVSGHASEGPRGNVWLACIGEEHAEEAFGSARASLLERWVWRLRWLAYVLIHHFFTYAYC